MVGKGLECRLGNQVMQKTKSGIADFGRKYNSCSNQRKQEIKANIVSFLQIRQ